MRSSLGLRGGCISYSAQLYSASFLILLFRVDIKTALQMELVRHGGPVEAQLVEEVVVEVSEDLVVGHPAAEVLPALGSTKTPQAANFFVVR